MTHQLVSDTVTPVPNDGKAQIRRYIRGKSETVRAPIDDIVKIEIIVSGRNKSLPLFRRLEDVLTPELPLRLPHA